jgi:Fe2+ or Zn2+ uptake regulation protein
MQDLVPKGFVVQAHEITLSGLCADCRLTGGAAT